MTTLSFKKWPEHIAHVLVNQPVEIPTIGVILHLNFILFLLRGYPSDDSIGLKIIYSFPRVTE
jgi:hypothetical protein